MNEYILNKLSFLTALFFAFSPYPLHAGQVSLQSGWTLTFVSDPAEGVALGGISQLTTPKNETIFQTAGDQALFDWTGGVKRPTSVEIDANEQQIISTLGGFRSNGGAPLPLKAQMIFTGNSVELFCEVILTAESACRLENGVSIVIPSDDFRQIDFFNTRGKLDNNIIPLELTEPFLLPFQNRIIVRSGLGAVEINLRNPLMPVPKRTSEGVELELINWFRPNTTNNAGLKNLSTILLPGDTIRVEWSVASAGLNEPAKAIASFSPHPRGGDCSAYLAFDDIPSVEPNWVVPTGPENPATPVTSRWLRVLDEFPDVKFTWLLLTDNIQRMGNWHFPGWWPPTRNVLPDSLSTYSGNYACRMTPDGIASNGAVISQLIIVKPGDRYRIDLNTKADFHQDTLILSVLIYSWNPAYYLSGASFKIDSEDWVNHPVEFVSDSISSVSISIRVENGSGSVLIDDVTCTSLVTGENVLLGSSFESYQPFIYYESPDSSWINAKGFCNLAKEAPESYRRWLKIIQDGSPEWDYSDQVSIGLHGMHHTPDTLFATDVQHTHEFNFYDPIGDSVRMKIVAEDITLLGLDTNKVLAFFRFPGHRHTESLLKPLLDHGVRVIDQGNFIDEFFLGRIQRIHRSLWVTSSVSWHDEPNEPHPRHLESTLNSGMFGLMGCHYHLMNSAGTPGEGERTRNFFAWIEQNYPNLVWLKGSELADLWDEIGEIRNLRQTGYGEVISLSWDGAASREETIVIHYPATITGDIFCSVDGIPVASKVVGERLFVSLPEIGYGSHRFEASVIQPSQRNDEADVWKVIHESSDAYMFGRNYLETSNIRVAIFDLNGRQLTEYKFFSLNKGMQKIRINKPVGSSGLYFVQISDGSRTESIKLISVH